MRRLLSYSARTAGGLMTPEPIILRPDATVAEALARIRNPDIPPALASMVFVCRPPSETPTGRYLGCAHAQRLLREAPFELVAGVVDTDLARLAPEATLGEVTRYFAAYNLVAGPVVDGEDHLLGAVTVDDVLDHLLPPDWRDRLTEPEDGDRRQRNRAPHRTRRSPMPENTTRRRLDQPLLGRARFEVDPDWFARLSERIARFLGTGRFLAIQTVLVIVWIMLNLFAVQPALGPVPVHPAQPGLLHPGRVRRAADPAGPEPAGRPGPDLAGGGPGPRRAHQGRHRVPGPRAGRAADRGRRGGHPGLPARRAGQAGRADRGCPQRRGADAGRDAPADSGADPGQSTSRRLIRSSRGQVVGGPAGRRSAAPPRPGGWARRCAAGPARPR